MNNSVFRKTMENISKHRYIKLVMNEKVYLKKVMKPDFDSGIIFSKNLMGCEMGKASVIMDKPVYKFHYDYMKSKYSENLQLCYMDTSCLAYNIKTDDFYEDITGNVKARFDTSGCTHSKDCSLPIGVNKKVIGLMKEELGGKVITKFVVLGQKLYAYKP